MEFKQFIYNLKGHFTTITRHRHEVMKTVSGQESSGRD